MTEKTTTTTNESFTVRSYAPWDAHYKLNTDRWGDYTYANLEVRSGDVAVTVSLGSGKVGLLALAEALTRTAEKLDDARGNGVDWYVRDGVDIPQPKGECGSCGCDDSESAE